MLFGNNLDLNKNQLLNPRMQNLSSDPSTPVVGQFYFNTVSAHAWVWTGATWEQASGVSGGGGLANAYTSISDGTTTASASGATAFKLRTANNAITIAVANDDATHGDNALFTFNVGNVDHNSLANITTGDPHTQYVHISTARTITIAHTFNPGSAGVPFILGANAQNQKVTGLEADKVDGFHASATPGASTLVASGGGNTIAAGWIQEVIALADLTDVTAKTGTGTVVVMDTGPTITNAVFAGTFSAGNIRIQNVATPTSGTDAANKTYVDSLSAGLDPKASVRAASTATVTVTYNATGGTSARGQITAAPNTLDGVTLAAGNRILLKNQSTAAQNGIWVVTTLGTGANGVWDRATDFDEDAEVTAGAFVFVTEGTANSDTGWTLTTNDPIIIGGASGTSLAFTQFSSIAQLSFTNVGTTGIGTYDSISGTVVSMRKVNAASNKVTVVLNGQMIDLDVAEANLTLNNIGGTLGLTKGGTGQATAATGRGTSGLGTHATAPANATNVVATARGIPLKATFVLTGTGAATSFTLTHNLGTQDVVVQIQDSSRNAIIVDWVATDANTVTVSFATAPANASTWNVTVIG